MIPYNERLDQAVRLFQDGVAGSATAVLEANRLLEELRSAHPGHPLADAYHGAVMILVARDKTKPLDKLRWSKNGLKLLDQAVKAAPHDRMIRMLRGRAAYKLPEKHFGRTQTAIEDYSFLMNQDVSLFLPEEISQVIYELGEAYSRVGRNHDAVTCWRRALELTPDPELKQLLEQKLHSMEGKPAYTPVQQTASSASVMLGVAAKATGNALQRWAKKKAKEAAKQEAREAARRKRSKKKRRR